MKVLQLGSIENIIAVIKNIDILIKYIGDKINDYDELILEYTNKTNYKRISIMISLDQILNLHYMQVQNNYFLPIFDNLIDK